MKVALSIDFGTTNTLIASIGDDGKVTVFHLGRSGQQCPSTVYMQADGSLFFGDDAEDMAQIDPAGYRRAFKMKLGSPAPMLGRYTAADITAKFLSHLLEQVRQDASMRGATIGSVVLTCPVNFSPAQRESLRRAAVAAGLSKVELVDEPAAAGLAFCRSTGTQAFKHNALVVDWGGGTLDMALVTRGADGRVTVNSAYSYGRNDMGGEVFDDCLCEHMLSKVTLPQVAWPNLNRRVRALKHRLSTHESGIFNIVSEGRMVSEPIKRSTFEQLIAPNLRLVGAAVKRLLECVPADKKPEMLVLVGGSALVPCIRRELEQASGLPTHTWNEAHVAIVKGGAYWSAPVEKKKAPNAPEKKKAPNASLPPLQSIPAKPVVVDVNKVVKSQPVFTVNTSTSCPPYPNYTIPADKKPTSTSVPPAQKTSKVDVEKVIKMGGCGAVFGMVMGLISGAPEAAVPGVIGGAIVGVLCAVRGWKAPWEPPH